MLTLLSSRVDGESNSGNTLLIFMRRPIYNLGHPKNNPEAITRLNLLQSEDCKHFLNQQMAPHPYEEHREAASHSASTVEWLMSVFFLGFQQDPMIIT